MKETATASFMENHFTIMNLVTLYLYTKPVQIKDLVLQKSEIQSVKWFNLNQLMKDIKNNAPGYCLYYDELQILKAALDNR